MDLMSRIPPHFKEATYYEFLTVALQITWEGGKLIKHAFYDPKTAPLPTCKGGNQIDLVTATGKVPRYDTSFRSSRNIPLFVRKSTLR
jgi:hypothetical protein